jgi:hypothetical protein
LEHLQVAVRVPEGRDGSAADELVNTYRFTLLVVDELDLRQFHEHGFAVAQFEVHLAGAADDLLWWNAARQDSAQQENGARNIPPGFHRSLCCFSAEKVDWFVLLRISARSQALMLLMPMSSPQITRMLGFWACAEAGSTAPMTPSRIAVETIAKHLIVFNSSR